MVKRPSQIFVALGTVLNQNETTLLVRVFGALVVVLFVLLTTAITLWEYTPSHQRLFTMVFFSLFVLIILFIVTRYMLLNFFKTKRSLDFLIRETLHELNVPLSVIKANVQMLQANEITPKELQRLNRIATASDELYRLYQDVEYFIRSQIRTKTEEPFDLYEAIQGVLESCKPLAENTPLQCTTALHVTLLSDRRSFCKAITNVVSNAIKYNQNNAPICIYQEENILIIEDQGIGMSEAELFLVFDRYYQTDSSKEGYGIGLSLVKAYCDSAKISLSIDSKKGKGTKVFFDLSRLIVKNAIIQ